MENSFIEEGVLDIKRIFPERASLDATEKGPEPRSMHTMAMAPDGKLWIFGGQGDSTNARRRKMDKYPLFRELWVYDTKKAENPWIHYSQPYAYVGSTSVFHKGELLIIGGLEVNGFVAFQWLRMDTQRGMQALFYGPFIFSHGMVKIGSELYMFGGFNDKMEPLKKMMIYNLDLSVTIIPSADPNGPPAMCDPGMATYGGEIFLIGGQTSSASLNDVGFAMVWVYNIENNRWAVCGTIPDPQRGYPRFRRSHRVVTWGNFAFLLGGIGVGDVILDDIWLFNMSLRHWICLNIKLRRPVYNHASCIDEDGTCYVFGGILSGMQPPFIRSRALYKTNLVHHALVRLMTLSSNAPAAMPILGERKYGANRKKKLPASQSCATQMWPPAILPQPISAFRRIKQK